jgi:hypothetical protein
MITMNIFHNLIIIVALSIFLIGCEKSEIIEEPLEKNIDIEFLPIIYSPDANPHKLLNEAKSEKERNKIHEEFISVMNKTSEIEDLIKQTSNWQNAHEVVSETLRNNSSDRFNSYMEQVLANTMLARHLPSELEVDDVKKEAIAYYTNLLINNKNPNAPLISNALNLLQGYWPDTEIKLKIDNVIKYSTEYLEKKEFVNRVGVDKYSVDLLENAKERIHHNIYFAITELGEMRSGLENKLY